MSFLGNNCWIILLIVIILMGSDNCGCNSCNTLNSCGCNNGCGCN